MATKKQRNLIIFLIVVLGILVASGSFLSFGVSTLSLDQVDLKSSNPYLSGQAWLVTFSGNPLGQSFFGSFSPNDIEQATFGDETTENGFTIDVDYTDTTCEYSISGSLQDIRYPVLSEWGCVFNPTLQQAKDQSNIANILYYGRYGGGDSFTCFALGWNTKAPVKSIQNPDIGAEYTININTDNGQSASRTFRTLDGSTSGNVGNFAYSVWNGNLDSGKSCPTQTDHRAAYVNGQWRTIDKQNYDNYVNAYNDQSSISNIDLFDARQRITNWKNNVLSKAQTADNTDSFGSIKNAFDLNNGKIEVTTDTPLAFPVTSLYIKASTLGIYTPVPDIRIVSTNSQCFSTGEEGYIAVTIKNDGETGGYTSFANCGGVFDASQNVQGTINAGATKTLNIPITAQADKKETSSCTITVESTGNTVTASQNVCVDPLITCEVPYPTKFCSPDNTRVQQCSQDGVKTNTLEICETGFICSDAECVAEDTVEKGFFDKIKDFFKDLFGGALDFLTTLKYVISILLGLVVAFVSNDLLKSLRGLKKNKGGRILISVIAGVGLGIVMWQFLNSIAFWIIAGVAIVFIFIAPTLRRR